MYHIFNTTNAYIQNTESYMNMRHLSIIHSVSEISASPQSGNRGHFFSNSWLESVETPLKKYLYRW